MAAARVVPSRGDDPRTFSRGARWLDIAGFTAQKRDGTWVRN